MVDRNDLAEMFAGQRYANLNVPPVPDPYKVSPSQAITEGGNILGPHVGDVFSNVLSYIPWLGKYVAGADELQKTPEERLADIGAQPISPTDVNAPAHAVLSAGGGAAPAPPPSGGRPRPEITPAPAKKLTKKQTEELARQDELNRIIEARGMEAGANRMPFVNPDRDELARIRAEHGESPIVRAEGDLYAGSTGEEGRPPYTDAKQTSYLFPPATERTREQRPLPRIEGGTPSARVTALTSNPKVVEAIKAAAEKGRGVQDWYDTTPLQQVFVQEFGPEEGMQRFGDFIAYVASTSTGQKIGPNIRIGSNYYAQKYGGGRDFADQPIIRRGDTEKALNPPTKDPNDRIYGPKYEGVLPAYEVPPEGYGADKQQTHMHNVNNYSREGVLSSLNNPKIAAFFENLMGNWEPTTIDKHAVRLTSMASRDPRWLSDQGGARFAELTRNGGMSEEQAIDQLMGQPTNWSEIADKKTEYGQVEQMWTQAAKEMGVTPAELQAMAWVGGGQQTGLGSAPVTFMDAFADRIRRTSIRDNIPPEQVLQLMLHGKLTLAQLAPSETAMQGTSMVG